MNRFLTLILLAPVCACAPTAPDSGPETVVKAIYRTLETGKGEQSTPLAEIPMTSELAALVQKAEAAGGDNEPVFDGDFAGNCQDCTGFSDLVVTTAASAGTKDRAIVNADFKLFKGEQRHVQWEMLKTPQGWRVDNIVSDGFDIRAIAQEIIASPPGADSDGDKAVACLAYLSLHADALKKASPPGDASAFEAAKTAWRKTADAFYSADEFAQYFASSIAVLDDLAPADLEQKARDCLANAPA